MYEHDYSQTDIYSVNVETKKIDRVTNTNHNESHPVWSKTSDNIFYTSDHNGVGTYIGTLFQEANTLSLFQ